MKRILSIILFLTAFSGSSQKVIFESAMGKEAQLPHKLEFSKLSHSLLLENGTFKGALRSYNSLQEISLDDFSTKTIFENQKLLGVRESLVDKVYFGPEHSGVGWAKDEKFIDAQGKVFASQKINNDVKYATKDRACFVSNKKGEHLESFKAKDDIYFSTLNLKDLIPTTIALEKPEFLKNFKGETYIFPIYKKDYFVIEARVTDENRTSLVDKWAHYDYNGKKIAEDKRVVSLGVPLIFTDTAGGRTNEGIYLLYHEDERRMAFFGKYTDLEGNLYYYGAYGEREGRAVNNETRGFYVVKYSSTGNPLWDKKFEIIDKDINENASKTNLNSCLETVGNSLRFTLTKHVFDQYFYYAELDPKTGEKLNSNKITFKVDSVGQATFLTTPLLSFFKIEGLKYIRMDFNTMYFYQTNAEIKKHIDGFTGKDEIHMQCHFNKDGIFLSESDNKKFYKIRFFKL